MANGSNVQTFISAGMLSQTAAQALTPQQRNTIESWDAATVQLLISTFKQTGEIQHGVLWI